MYMYVGIKEGVIIAQNQMPLHAIVRSWMLLAALLAAHELLILYILYFRLIYLSKIKLQKVLREGVRTVYSYNNVDAGFARFTMLSSNFLNQLNLLLFEQ